MTQPLSPSEALNASIGPEVDDPFIAMVGDMLNRLYNPPTDMTPIGRLVGCIDTLAYLVMLNAKLEDGQDTNLRYHSSCSVYVIKALAEWENDMTAGSFIQDNFFPNGPFEVAPKSELWGQG